ncbi:MAG TPA: hypothetical protein VFV41_18385 [Streptosporangiaceae bacterium]|nr:hypothetical protein [Streptosporangiaceae bacterium]
MTGPDDSQRPVPGRAPGDPDDFVELGDRRLAVLHGRLPWVAVILAAAGLVAGLAAGYAAGYQHARAAAAPRPRSQGSAAAGIRPATASPFIPAVVQDAGLCSAVSGHTLQLGVQILNQSAAPVRLRRVEAILAMSGLRPVRLSWGACGELPVALAEPVQAVQPGGSAWFTVSVRVLVRCPAAYPVQFRLRYEQHGRAATVILPGFSDLSRVPYPGCPGAEPAAPGAIQGGY